MWWLSHPVTVVIFCWQTGQIPSCSFQRSRRVNALAAYRPYGRAPRLEVATAERTWKAEDLVAFLRSLPWARCPRVVVLDNAGLHTKAARLARRELIGLGIYPAGV